MKLLKPIARLKANEKFLGLEVKKKKTAKSKPTKKQLKKYLVLSTHVNSHNSNFVGAFMAVDRKQALRKGKASWIKDWTSVFGTKAALSDVKKHKFTIHK